MPKTPFMPLYTSDYLGDTGHLSTEQHGAYLLLLMQMWNAGGSLPSDPKKLARVARLSTKKWLGMADEILAFFHVDNDTISSQRLSEERQKVDRKSDLRRAAGAKGGRAKALKNNKTHLANAKAKVCHFPEPDKLEEAKASSSLEPQKAFDAYCAVARRLQRENAGKRLWPIPAKLDAKRKAKLKARLKEHGLEAWGVVLRKAAASPHCTGANGWVANFDFLISPDGFTKTLEGNYDDRSHTPAARNSGSGPRGNAGDGLDAFDRLAARLDEHRAGGPGMDAQPSQDRVFDFDAVPDEAGRYAVAGH